MANLTDSIEDYIKDLLERNAGVVEIQRSELAALFSCAPSQINYVLDTRFSPQRGYLVESRRGGGGYIRIIRLNITGDLRRLLSEQIGDTCTQDEAVGLIRRLAEEGLITERESLLMQSVVQRDALPLDLPLRDRVRASLLKAMLLTVLRF